MKTILVLTDFSKKAFHATEYALNIAAKVKADLLLYHAVNLESGGNPVRSGPYRIEQFFQEEDDSKLILKQLATELKKKLEKLGDDSFRPSINFICRTGEIGNLGAEILDIVEDNKIWMIVMGAKGEECVSNFIFGSNTFSVISKVRCPVLFVPEKAPLKNISKIALATDLKDHRELSAVMFLKDFKDAFNSEVLVTHLVTPETTVPANQDRELVQISRFDYDANQEYPEVSFIDVKGSDLKGDLHDFARRSQVDIVGIIHHKENMFQRIFHSSTTKLLIDSARLPLLVFPLQ